MKKVFILIAILVGLGLLATGCGKVDTSTQKPKTEVAQEKNLNLTPSLKEPEKVVTEPSGSISKPENNNNGTPDAALLKTVRSLVDNAYSSKQYYFEMYGYKVWRNQHQVKMELWDLVDANSADITGERMFSGITLSDHKEQKFKLIYLDRDTKQWKAMNIQPLAAAVDVANYYHDALGIRLNHLKEILDGWNGVNSEVERNYLHRNNAVTYLELKSMNISEGTITHERDGKSWAAYIIQVEFHERIQKGGTSNVDIIETFYIDKNSGYPVTYQIKGSINSYVTETYEYNNLKAKTHFVLDFDMEPVQEP